MTDPERIRVFDSQGEAYKQAFQIFLDHTDQKRNAKRWPQRIVDDLGTASSGGFEYSPSVPRHVFCGGDTGPIRR